MARPIAAPLLATALAAATLAGAALAQGTRQGATPMPAIEENRREARLLADIFDITRQAEALLVRVRSEIIAATIKQSGLPQPEAERIVDEIMMPNFRARQAELEALMIELLAENFTYSDLRALRAFYASPLGQKLQRTLPAVRDQGAQAGLAWSRQVFQDSVDRHADELRARGLKF